MTDKKFVIIGDGVAGATAAEKLRDEEEEASIKVITDESEPLYNRIMLKTFMKGRLPKQYARVHDEGWYQDRDIELELETEVEDINKDREKIITAEGDEHPYDRLLVATGGSPRKFPCDSGFENVNYMWTIGEAERIKESAKEVDEAVVIGGGLLGIDLAVAYAENDVDVKYLIRGDNWWSRGLDESGADIIHDRLEKKGCEILTNTEAVEFKGDEKVEKVITDKGEELECDTVAVAIGQTANSDIIDVEKNDSGMIKTDSNLKTSEESIFAAGNMVEYYSPVFEKRTVNGSWDHSEEMGETAAMNMLGNQEEFDYVNTYGVGHFDAQFLAVGDWSGEPISRKYDADHYRRLFFDGDRIIGGVMIGYTKGQERLREMIAEKKEFENKEKLLDKEFWES